MKDTVRIYSRGNEYYFLWDGKEQGGFPSKEAARKVAIQFKNAKGKRHSGRMLNYPFGPERVTERGVILSRPREEKLVKSDWFTLLKKKKKREVADPNRFAFTSYNNETAEEAKRKRESILNNPEIKRNAKKKKIEELIKRVEQIIKSPDIRPRPWYIANLYKDDFREAQKKLEEQVINYFLYESYLTFLEGLLKNDKELDSVMETDRKKYDEYKLFELGHEYYTKEKNHDNFWGQKDKLPAMYDRYEEQLKAEMYGSYACRDCGTEVSGKDKEDKCKYCGGENFTTINSPRD